MSSSTTQASPPRPEVVRFPTASGHELVGRMHWPDASPIAVALFAHCFTCSKDIHAAVRISRALAEQGWATLRFDFTGIGESEGDFADTDFSSNLDDLVAAADFLRDHHEAPTLLVGHSLGGAAVIAAAHRIPEARAVATIGAPFDPAHVEHLIAPQAPELAERGEATIRLGGASFRVRAQLLDDLAAQPQERRIRELGRALLVAHAPGDTIVSVDNAARIFTAARHPRSFLSLDDADHLLTTPSDAQRVGALLATWAAHYVRTP